MIRTNRFFGGVLLVAGTSIGAGMLALPVTTGFGGFFPSLGVLAILWLFMLITALLFLEVNLFMEGEVNLVTMAKRTLGMWGKVLSWVTYLLLLYSLTAAYIAGSSPLFVDFVKSIFHFTMPHWIAPFPLLILFGIIVYLGTKSVDYLNRILMIGLVLAYILLVCFLPVNVQFNLLKHVDMRAAIIGIPVVITSFGFHIIIPTLTTYMNHEPSRLRWCVIVGSIIPFLVYLLWEFLILGIVPLWGENGLIQAFKDGSSATIPLSHILNNPWISVGAHLFSFFAIITSFLGVSISLSDFLTDGLKLKRTGGGRLIACLLTFIPPLIFVLVYQHGFILALQYAGAFVAILLGFLPAAMAWTLPKPSYWRTFFGRCLLVTIILISIFVVVMDFVEEGGGLKKLTEIYTQKQ